jgi:nitrate reductase delta subunit
MAMLGTLRKSTDHLQALDHVAGETRDRFGLSEETVISVSEVACAMPGCPPLETIVVFWTVDGVRHRFKIFKPATEVTRDDMPAAWLRRALEAPDDYDDSCC